MAETEVETQVIVVGAGNAGMTAAISAHDAGARVVILERAPKEFRGGNSALTGYMRFPYESPEDLKSITPDLAEKDLDGIRQRQAKYTADDFLSDIMRTTKGRSDPELAKMLVTRARPTVDWLRSIGHEWKPDYERPDASKALTMLGGGAGLQRRNFAFAEQRGIAIHYDTRARELLEDSHGKVVGVRALGPDGYVNYLAQAVVLTCGGFEGNIEMRVRYLGPEWGNVKMRGVPFNTGDGLRMALEQLGAMSFGNWGTCHASPQDVGRPEFQLPGMERKNWNRYGYPFGIMVNLESERFVDEGADIRRFTYAKMGRLIQAQPEQRGFQIFDSKPGRAGLLSPDYSWATGAEANTIEELAAKLELSPNALGATVSKFNQAVGRGTFNGYIRDQLAAEGITPPKSNWAQRIDSPPYYGYRVCGGITFTFGGVRVDGRARVMHLRDRPVPGLYAAGEMVGGLWHDSYPSGSGMMAGAVFGRTAGVAAARECLDPENAARASTVR